MKIQIGNLKIRSIKKPAEEDTPEILPSYRGKVYLFGIFFLGINLISPNNVYFLNSASRFMTITSYLIMKLYTQRLKILGLIHNLILRGPFSVCYFPCLFILFQSPPLSPASFFPLITLRTYLINAAYVYCIFSPHPCLSLWLLFIVSLTSTCKNGEEHPKILKKKKKASCNGPLSIPLTL